MLRKLSCCWCVRGDWRRLLTRRLDFDIETCRGTIKMHKCVKHSSPRRHGQACRCCSHHKAFVLVSLWESSLSFLAMSPLFYWFEAVHGWNSTTNSKSAVPHRIPKCTGRRYFWSLGGSFNADCWIPCPMWSHVISALVWLCPYLLDGASHC